VGRGAGTTGGRHARLNYEHPRGRRSFLDSARRQHETGPWGYQDPRIIRLATPTPSPGAPPHRPTPQHRPNQLHYSCPLDKTDAISGLHDGQNGDPVLGYAEEELVAESVAHLAVSFVGLDSSAFAVPYLAGWAEEAAADTFEQIAGLVDRLARRLEDALSADATTAATPAVNAA